MDKSCHSSASDSSATTSSTNTTTTTSNNYLRHLNKLSQKISKPPHSHNPLVKKPNFEPPPPSALNPPPPQHNHTHSNLQQQQQQQQQPPVYNINKNDFRDVVQKLTGSPAPDRFSNPPPINNPKPQSSRLQRIRPPPLAQLTNRPPPLLNCAPPPNLNPNHLNPSSAGFIHRPGAPHSPLPPLPAVHAAAESPVSAYMRYLHASMAAVDPNLKPFSGFHPPGLPLSPRWGSLTAPPPPPLPGSSAGFGSPPLLPFGCLNSPRSPYALRSPNSGQLGIPLSPTVPVPSPTWRGL